MVNIEQGKALKQLMEEDKLPLKVKQLQDELRISKDKTLKLTQVIRENDKNSKI